jgi:hypothetical protein
MAGTVHRIRNWKGCFEVAQNKACKAWSWIAVPIKHDGKSFRRLMSLPNGPAIYGAWILIAAVAAKCEPRGTLLDDGMALTPEDLHFKTGAPESLFLEAFEALTSDRIGWLELVEIDHAQATLEQTEATLELHNGTGRDSTGQNNNPDRPEGRPAGNLILENQRQDLPDWPELKPFAERSVEPLCLADLPDRVRSELSGKRAYEPISEPWLRNTADLAAWHRWQLTLSQPVLGKSVAHLLLVLCAAEDALGMPKESVRKNRVAVFVNCIKRRDWASLRDRFPRALKRLEAMP